MTKTNTRSRIVSILLVLVMLLSLLPTTAFAAGSAETTDITEINLTGDYQHGNVSAGILPAFNHGTTTDSITIDETNSFWVKRTSTTSSWGGFAGNTPVAYNDGKTDYGYTFRVVANDGYQLASGFKVFYNGKEVTSTVEVSKYSWGAYVTVDLGKAIGENPATHTVTFVSNGGTEIAPKEVVSGLKINEPSKPTKDKYLFRGWYEDATFSTKFDFYNTPITSDMTLYAKWEAANSINEIRLIGNYQYGNVPEGTLPSFNPRTTTDSITIDNTNSFWVKRTSTTSLWGGFAGNTPVAYNDGKTDYGYTFRVVANDGYQLASGFKVFYNGKEVTSTVEVSKYSWGAYVTVDLGKAIGTPVVYTITFNSNDGTSVESQNVNAGEKLTEPTPAPTREGFTFDGWYEDSTFSTKFDFNTPITDNMTLYAKWTENKYTLTFDANGGSGTMTPVTDLTGEYTLPANEFTAPSGKQFKGWSLTADGAIVTKVDMTENRTVYAIWENIPVVTYTVSFAANGGTGTMADVTGISGEYTLPANGFTAPAGKQFKAWSVGGVEKAVGDKITVTANTTVTAVWEDIPVVTYTVSFDANGGTGSMADVTGVSGEYTLPANGFTAPAGKQFKAWSVGGVEKAAGDTITVNANTTVTAIWGNIPVVTYTVSFAANGGTGTMADVTGVSGEYTLPANGFTAPAGKQFKAWSVGGVEKAAGDTITVNANTTITAIWEPIPVTTYTVSFDANGGSGSMADVTNISGSYTLPACTFTAPSDKQFKGWATSADGSVISGTTYEVSSDTIFYAIWESKEYSITVTDGKATIGAGSEISKAAEGTAVTLTANAAPSGKVFDKWVVKAGGVTLANETSVTTTFTMPGNDVKIEATYKDAPPSDTPPSDTPSYGIYVGMTYTAGNFIYQITSIDTATLGQSKVIGVVAAKKNKITKVTIPDRADCKGYRLNVTAVGDNAFAGCKALKKLTIGNKVTVIGKNAFKKCSKLETVVIGKAVKTISSKAFIGDNKIKKITFKGKKLKTVNKNAFSKKAKKNIKSKKTKLKGNKKAIKLFKKKLKIK